MFIIKSISATVIIILMGIFYYNRYQIIKNYKVFVPAMIPVIGLFFYWFRVHQRLLYGLVEVGFGIVSGISFFEIKVSNSSLDVLTFFSILGSVYVIVRGLDNIYHGAEGTIFEPYLKYILFKKSDWIWRGH